MRYVVKPGEIVLRDQKNLRIDLGCGSWKREGFVGFDADKNSNADFICDLNNGIPLPDSCAIEVYASHFLEHVNDLAFMLQEIWRICQSDSVVVIVQPNWQHYYSFMPDHKRVIPPVFFQEHGWFVSLFELESIIFDHDQNASQLISKHFPNVSLDEAQVIFSTLARQFYVTCKPKKASQV